MCVIPNELLHTIALQYCTSAVVDYSIVLLCSLVIAMPLRGTHRCLCELILWLDNDDSARRLIIIIMVIIIDVNTIIR